MLKINSQALNGAAALLAVLDTIGEPEVTDHTIVKVLVESEASIRALIEYATKLAFIERD